MSWQPLVDQLLLSDAEGHHLTDAAAIGFNGGVYAKSDNFPKVTAAEIEAIVNGFKGTVSFVSTGLSLGGTKYTVFLEAYGDVVSGEKGSGGVTVMKTNSALIFGIYDAPMTSKECDTVVSKLGDYLVSIGY